MKRWTPDPTLLGGMRATVHGTFIDHHDFRQALAEKDEKIERLTQEAQIHAQEARTANRTIAEIYQVVSGATGEPGNWHGAEPVEQALAEKDLEIASIKHAYAQLSEAYEANVAGIPLGPRVRAQTIMDQQIAYQQLMAKAVRFAAALYDPNVQVMGDPLYAEAQAFLKEHNHEMDK